MGAGIGAHIDTHSAFEDTIAAVSLGSGCTMILQTIVGPTDLSACTSKNTDFPTNQNTATSGVHFQHMFTQSPDSTLSETTTLRYSVFLPRRSLVVLHDEARYAWCHSIPFCEFDTVKGVVVPREVRVSLTYRTELIDNLCNCRFPFTCDSQSAAVQCKPLSLEQRRRLNKS